MMSGWLIQVITIAAVCAGGTFVKPLCSRTLNAASSVTKSAAPTIGAGLASAERPSNSPSSASIALAHVDLSSWRADGRSGTIRHRGKTVTHVVPLRGYVLSGTASGVPMYQCGARLQTASVPAQSLILVGVASTEALSCDGIKAFGAVPAPSGVDRIAFIYRGSSPNARGVNTVVIVESNSATTVWSVNDALSHKLDQRGNLTSVPAIRAYLARTGNRN